MENNLESLITRCVLGGVMFKGALGTASYSVQDLVHSLNVNNIDSMWVRAKKELSALDEGSLFKTGGSSKKTRLRLEVDTLEAVFAYKQEQAQKAVNRAKAKQEAQNKLVHLKNIKTEKELKALGKLSMKQLQEQIEEAEKLAGSHA